MSCAGKTRKRRAERVFDRKQLNWLLDLGWSVQKLSVSSGNNN